MRLDRRLYVRRVLALYRTLTGDHVRPRRHDRLLAERLHEQGVSIEILEAAIRLAIARRNARPDHVAPLQPVRSLHYFLPVIEEIGRAPNLGAYLRYLRHRDHGTAGTTTSGTTTPATVQKNAVLRER